ncbi:S1 family peptidase [Aequorivita antarctica]|uniref:Trypsin-like peptidase domain-containing protein n=1 Tax=Aequorivita antarctica TaxID=153266 RepID=A0A5C6YZX4_9FLAO|nr:serine protease [Aequorivita antarctica]TXD73323.1 trypsin-like peptidase domain-containing protein [Aequorivita antarctica]SRX76435.1 Serine protease Do-like HtrA [Aequorivita antarctica]
MLVKRLQNLLYYHQDLSQEIATFFLSKTINPDYFNEIVDFLCKKHTHLGTHNQITLGMFKPEYYREYKLRTGAQEFRPHIPLYTIEVLVQSGLLKDLEPIINTKVYQENTKFTTHMYFQGLIPNILFGTRYIIERYRNSVFKIENTDKNDKIDIGTGFLIKDFGKNIIVTNEHVIAKAKKLRLLDVDDKSFKFSILYENKYEDVAFLEIEVDLSKISEFVFSQEQEILSEIITIGYPSIPMSKAAYQVIHKGEINSHIENYSGNKLFLISAKTSSGNSGSPVINEKGQVLGMVAQELFEKGALIEKGKLPYIVVIPTSTIFKLLYEFIEGKERQ